MTPWLMRCDKAKLTRHFDFSAEQHNTVVCSPSRIKYRRCKKNCIFNNKQNAFIQMQASFIIRFCYFEISREFLYLYIWLNPSADIAVVVVVILSVYCRFEANRKRVRQHSTQATISMLGIFWLHDPFGKWAALHAVNANTIHLWRCLYACLMFIYINTRFGVHLCFCVCMSAHRKNSCVAAL